MLWWAEAQVLRDHELVAVNTWQSGGSRAGTFRQSNGTHTQLDYFLMRRSQVTAASRNVSIRPDLPFVPVSGMFHFPLFITFPAARRYTWCGPQPVKVTLQSVKTALEADPALAVQFQHRLHHIQAEDACATVNEQLLQAWCQIRPKSHKPQPRDDDVGGANTTMLIRDLWDKRQMVRQTAGQVRNLLGPQGLHGASFRVCVALFAQWRAQVATTSASKLLQKHCKQQKRKQVEQLIDEATAGGQSLTGLHRIMRRIAPKTPRRRMQLRGPAGELLSPQGQLQLIQGHFKRVYAAEASRCTTVRRFSFNVTVDEITAALQSLPRKALPHAFVPAPLWRLGAQAAAIEMHRELQWLVGCAQCTPPPQAHWHDVSVALLPKPNKALSDPASYRPISPLPPYAKVLAQLVAQRLRPLVLAAAESMEQFAYLPARQTADALDRAFAHCDDVRAACKASGTTIWTRKAGARPDTCRGGLTLSLDLERAFDSVPWATLEECLVEFGVPADLISLILFLHENARYTFTLGGETVNVEPQQGIRQGCGMSPTIWTLFSLHLAKKLSLVAPSSLRTYFADDLLLQWEFLDDLAFRFIPQEIAAVLTLLRREGMCISVNKTVILRSWWGSRVHDVTRPFLTKILHKRYFRVALDSGEVVHLPLVDSHKYRHVSLLQKLRSPEP